MAKFKAGDIVRLTDGAQEVTVSMDECDGKVRVVWFEEDGQWPQYAYLESHELTMVTPYRNQSKDESAAHQPKTPKYHT